MSSTSQSTAPRAARLFDDLFSDHPTQDPRGFTQDSRKALGTINSNAGRSKIDTTKNANYGGKKASASGSGDSGWKGKLNKRMEDKLNKKVKFTEKYPTIWEQAEARREKEACTRTKAPRKNKNYPDCTKEALLDAWEKAGLPDYDEIAKHELHVSEAQKWEVERPYYEKPATPPMKDLLKVFETTQQSTTSAGSVASRRRSETVSVPPAESPPKRMRRTRSSRPSDPVPPTPIIENSPKEIVRTKAASTMDTTHFKRGLRDPKMASTPLVSGRSRLPSFSTASTSSIEQKGDKTVTESRPFLAPNPVRRSKRSVCNPILMIHNPNVRREVEMSTPLHEGEEQEKTMVPSTEELSKEKSKVSKGNSSESKAHRSRKSSQDSSCTEGSKSASLDDGSVSEGDTVIEAPVKKYSSKEKTKNKSVEDKNEAVVVKEPRIKTTTIEVCHDSSDEEEAERRASKSVPRASRLFDQVFANKSGIVDGNSATNKSNGKENNASKASTPRRSPRTSPDTFVPASVHSQSMVEEETLRSRLSLDDSVPTVDDSRMSKHLLRRPSNLSSFFGATSTFQTPNHRIFSVVTDRRLHPTLKNMTTLNSSKLAGSSTFLGNQSTFGHSTFGHSTFGHSTFAVSARNRRSRVKSVIPDLSNSRRLTKTGSFRNVTINDPEELRNLIRQSLATAFNQTKVVFDDGKEEVLEPMDKVLALCDPTDITPFDDVLDKKFLKHIKKIGEGSYGEVYKSLDGKGKDLILKVVPFDPEKSTEEVFAAILPELIICSTFNALRTNSLNRTPNFINMTRAVCVQGRFPKTLVQKWDEFELEKPDGSENPDPREYGDDHLHLLMFLNNGGTDLETCTFRSGQEALSVLLQVTFSLAAAELEYEFEHRDLHIGNVLVMTTRETEMKYLVDGAAYVVPTNGVSASIIDFSLSRLSKDGFVIHQDLAHDEDLFNGTGDYQFEIYRKMKEETGNKWERFCPKTTHFLASLPRRENVGQKVHESSQGS